MCGTVPTPTAVTAPEAKERRRSSRLSALLRLSSRPTPTAVTAPAAKERRRSSRLSALPRLSSRSTKQERIAEDAAEERLLGLAGDAAQLHRRVLILSAVCIALATFAMAVVSVFKFLVPATTEHLVLHVGPVLVLLVLGILGGLFANSPTQPKMIFVCSLACIAGGETIGLVMLAICVEIITSCEAPHEAACAGWASFVGTLFVIDTSILVWFIIALKRRPHPRERLDSLWQAFRLVFGLDGLVIAVLFAVMPEVDQTCQGSNLFRRAFLEAEDVTRWADASDRYLLIAGSTTWVCFALALTPCRRRRVSAFLLQRISTQEVRAAAAVAAMVHATGGSKGGAVSRAIKRAREHFLALSVNDLTLADLASNEDTGLGGKVVRAALGGVDAFFSHSWRDPAEPKFAAVMAWARRFETSNDGRAPLIWLDKACINQTAIEESLALLPIFLSGCNTLLIVAGPTYSSRLWCVLECFIFLKMGGSIDRIELYPITPDVESRFALQVNSIRVVHTLVDFESGRATCFKPEERNHLLSVIETGFGSLHEFDNVVRAVLREKLEAHCDQMKHQSLWRGLYRKSTEQRRMEALAEGATEARAVDGSSNTARRRFSRDFAERPIERAKMLFQPTPEKSFELDTRVHHGQHGPGQVVELMEDGRTRVRFDSSEEHRYKPASMRKLVREYLEGDRVVHVKRGPGTVVGRMADGGVRVRFDGGEEHQYKPSSMLKLSPGAAAAAGVVPAPRPDDVSPPDPTAESSVPGCHSCQADATPDNLAHACVSPAKRVRKKSVGAAPEGGAE